MPTMHAMRCEAPGRPLEPGTFALPVPGPGELLIEVRACGVCRTDLHLVDGELANARYPVIPGHEIVGTGVGSGPGVTGAVPGSRVGVPWLGRTCGHCRYCTSGHENLCPAAEFTGCTRIGGYHLLCDACDAAAVARLRERKRRPHKPLAVMFPMDAALLERSGITLELQEWRAPVYPQLHGPFVPDLSIVDLLFSCGSRSLDILMGQSS